MRRLTHRGWRIDSGVVKIRPCATQVPCRAPLGWLNGGYHPLAGFEATGEGRSAGCVPCRWSTTSDWAASDAPGPIGGVEEIGVPNAGAPRNPTTRVTTPGPSRSQSRRSRIGLVRVCGGSVLGTAVRHRGAGQATRAHTHPTPVPSRRAGFNSPGAAHRTGGEWAAERGTGEGPGGQASHVVRADAALSRAGGEPSRHQR